MAEQNERRGGGGDVGWLPPQQKSFPIKVRFSGAERMDGQGRIAEYVQGAPPGVQNKGAFSYHKHLLDVLSLESQQRNVNPL